MQRISLVQWAKVLLCVTGCVTGCEDINTEGDNPNDLELRAEDPSEDENAGANVIPGHYIVMLKKGANPNAAAVAVQASPNHVYTDVMTGFAGKLNHGQLKALEMRADVLLIEPDQIVSTAAPECPDKHPKPYTLSKSEGAPYGLDRIDQEDLPLSSTYTWTWDGDGVNVYVVDTGIETKHSQFEGRAKATYDAFFKKNSAKYGQDCHGHGTHVAGIIGGKTYGVAKEATLHAVRVLDCNGQGTWSKMIAALDWLAKNHQKPAVVNMSLSGSGSLLVDSAVKKLVDSGVVVVVAAGNSNTDACKYSPARAPKALTIAANNSNDQRASFSNYGSCVDMYAPGTNITSAWLKGTKRAASGTSMAAPHVAGVAALYLDAYNGDASDIEDDLEDWAGYNMISGNPSNTANLLVHWPCSQ